MNALWKSEKLKRVRRAREFPCCFEFHRMPPKRTSVTWTTRFCGSWMFMRICPDSTTPRSLMFRSFEPKTVLSPRIRPKPSSRIACADVSDLKLNVGLQTGGGSGTPYYDIQLICRDGRKRTAGRQIRNKREAVWLMNQIKQAIRA